MAHARWIGAPRFRVVEPYFKHGPGDNIRQHAFLATEVKECLYGGAAGGGKTVALLMAALQYVDVEGYRAIILRRTFPELNGMLIPLAKDWLAPTDAEWNENQRRWTFPSGAVLQFGHLDTEDDKYRYQGIEFDFIGFDELTQFTESQYRYVAFSRSRQRAETRIPSRIRATSNPGGKGHRWVKERFVDGPLPGGRAFIRASLYDNPYVKLADYEETLKQLDALTRAQLLHGDWNAREEGVWFFDDRDVDAVERLGAELDTQRRMGALHPAGGMLRLGIDWGESTHGLIVWPLEQGGIYVPPQETVLSSVEPGESSRRMLHNVAAHKLRLERVFFDAAGVQSQKTFDAEARRVLGRAVPPSVGVPFGKHKAKTAGYLRLLFQRAGRGERTRVIAISPENRVLLEQLRQLERDPEGEAWRKDDDQHGPDALVAGVTAVADRYLADLARRKELATR